MAEKMKKTFYIVDDHEMLREGTKGWFVSHSDWSCVGDAANHEAAYSDFERMAKKDSLPFILICDLNFFGENTGFDFMKKIHDLYPDVKIIVYSMFFAGGMVQNAIKNPRKLDMNRIDAQQARRALDRLVGDALARRAFTIKTVTQSDYALKATADYFTRYGYSLNAPIYPYSWLEQGKWCYWKGSRAIIKGDVPDMYRTALESILEQGFTVWSSPENVGNYEQEH